jgi:ankyrin repeat protein
MHMRILKCGILLAVLAISSWASEARIADAAQKGDAAQVRSLLSQKVDLNAPQADGSTALHWIVRDDDLETADLLIRAGAGVSAANRKGITPLDLACVNGSTAMIRKLIDAGANPNGTHPDGQSPLITAARTGNPEAVRVLVDKGAAVNARENVAGQTALMVAIAENHPQAARVLLDRGADVNARTNIVQTPPATAGNLQGIGRAQNREKPVPQGGMTPLLYAARDGRTDIARMLLAAGANLNQAEANGESPLLVAINNGQTELAQFLLNQGADPNAVDSFGRAPLWSAVDFRNLDAAEGSGTNGVNREPVLQLIKTLLEHGANPNVQTKVEPPSRRWMMPFGARQWVNPAGQTPFVRAALAGDVAVMRLLLEYRGDPNIPTLAGVTALMSAAGIGWVPRQTYTEPEGSILEAVTLCVEHGADVNAANSKAFTALHGAAYRGLDDVVQFLVQKGARLDAKDSEGRTPAVFAEGAYLAGNPPERRSSTAALLQKLAASPR